MLASRLSSLRHYITTTSPNVQATTTILINQKFRLDLWICRKYYPNKVRTKIKKNEVKTVQFGCDDLNLCNQKEPCTFSWPARMLTGRRTCNSLSNDLYNIIFFTLNIHGWRTQKTRPDLTSLCQLQSIRVDETVISKQLQKKERKKNSKRREKNRKVEE